MRSFFGKTVFLIVVSMSTLCCMEQKEKEPLYAAYPLSAYESIYSNALKETKARVQLEEGLEYLQVSWDVIKNAVVKKEAVIIPIKNQKKLEGFMLASESVRVTNPSLKNAVFLYMVAFGSPLSDKEILNKALVAINNRFPLVDCFYCGVNTKSEVLLVETLGCWKKFNDTLPLEINLALMNGNSLLKYYVYMNNDKSHLLVKEDSDCTLF
jgi:hypothetical protein